MTAMKIRKSILMLAFAALGMTATAQTRDTKEVINECQRLYSDGEYSTAQILINRIDTEKLDAKTRQEAMLLKALITAGNDAHEGKALLLQYIGDYPETTDKGLIGNHIANAYFYTGDYKEACKWFSNSSTTLLTAQLRDKAMFNYALSLYECGREGEAENLLRNLSLSSKEYSTDAAFHLAVIDYNNDRLDAAYKTFKELETDKRYHMEVPYYLAGTYLKQGDAQRARNIANLFIADHKENSHGVRMQQILGAAEYALGNYEEAIEPLTTYIERSETPQRIAKYQLGLSLFETGEDIEKALEILGDCSQGDDAIAQNSLLHIGIIQHRQGNANSARMAFEQAATMTHDDDIREEAMYNYALSIHETRYSPFAESVKVFEKLLNEYPESQRTEQVEQYLVEVYMNTRNYDVALQSIEKLKNPSNEILEAKQKILYRMGIQKFIDQEMDEAVNYLDRSIELRFDNATYADANYWKGEALYNSGKYDAAAQSYNKALAAGGENSTMAIYGLGYSQFQQEKYSTAQNHFERFVNNCPTNEKTLRADALSRIGDCHFYKRQYSEADNYYKRAIETEINSGDYPLFRSALTQGLKKDYTGKISTLNRLLNEYPGTTYAEQGYYEMSRAYIELERYNDAIATYDELLEKHPESLYARRAMAEKAMIYNVIGDSEKAIKTYKETIEKYPHSEEAIMAAQDLKYMYIEKGEVDKFAEYAANTSSLGAINSSSIDTLTFIAAEKFYNRGDLEGAISHFNEYLEKFPKGAFVLNSHYYLGASYYKSCIGDKAIDHFEEVIEYPDNKYSEVSIMLAAEIYQEEGNYRAAEELYKMLLTKSSNNENKHLAKTGIMRNAFKNGNYTDVIKYAGELLADSNTAPEMKREAMYDRAKAYSALGETEKAVTDFKSLADDTRTKEGAEAKYLIAQTMFDNKQYTECEELIMEYMEIGTPHMYWMARSFVLLSDLYAEQGKNLEAKQYLISLRNNYDGDDDIDDMITDRLEKLEKNN